MNYKRLFMMTLLGIAVLEMLFVLIQSIFHCMSLSVQYYFYFAVIVVTILNLVICFTYSRNIHQKKKKPTKEYIIAYCMLSALLVIFSFAMCHFIRVAASL